MKKLNLGCGNDIKEGYVNLDFYNPRADVIHDLNVFPWPFEDNEFDLILCSHVLEHLNDLVKVMEEIHRIAKPNARVIIKVPHFSGFYAWTNPTHKRAFGLTSFNYFEADYPERYSDKTFKVIKRELHYYPDGTGGFRELISKIVSWVANKHQELCERCWCYLVGGFGEVYLELEVKNKQ